MMTVCLHSRSVHVNSRGNGLFSSNVQPLLRGVTFNNKQERTIS